MCGDEKHRLDLVCHSQKPGLRGSWAVTEAVKHGLVVKGGFRSLVGCFDLPARG